MSEKLEPPTCGRGEPVFGQALTGSADERGMEHSSRGHQGSLHVEDLNVHAGTCSCSLGRWGFDAMRRVAAVSGQSVGGWFFCRGILQRIVLCSRLHGSNAFSEPSALIEKMSVELGNRPTSYTSWSIVRDQLRRRHRRVQVPTHARRIKRGGCDSSASCSKKSR
jgi:hypothetical protein